MPMSMFGLGTVLLVAAITGRYGIAGVVAAAGSVGYAGAAPLAGKLADRFGQRQVLIPQAGVFGTASAGFLAAAAAGAPAWLLVVTGAVAGGTMPSPGSMVRARWSVLLAGSPRLHTAYSLESVTDEVIFVIGPVLVTLLATDVHPAAGVAAATLLCLAGTLLFAAQRRTQPPPGRPHRHGNGRYPGRARGQEPGRARGQQPGRACGQRTGQAGGEAPGNPTGARAGHGSAAAGEGGMGGRRGGAGLPARGLLTLVPVYWFLGAMFATIDVTTVAFAAQRGHKPLAGAWLGLYALGSAIGGLWYGSRDWHSLLPRRFLVALACTVSGAATFWLAPGLAALAVVMLVSGLAVSPTLIAGYGLIEQQAPAGRRTEGLTWLSSAISIGIAAGSPAAGHIIDAWGPRWGYVFAASCGAAALLTCLAGAGGLRARPAPRGPAAEPAHTPALQASGPAGQAGSLTGPAHSSRASLRRAATAIPAAGWGYSRPCRPPAG
jgi:MFS family permease